MQHVPFKAGSISWTMFSANDVNRDIALMSSVKARRMYAARSVKRMRTCYWTWLRLLSLVFTSSWCMRIMQTLQCVCVLHSLVTWNTTTNLVAAGENFFFKAKRLLIEFVAPADKDAANHFKILQQIFFLHYKYKRRWMVYEHS